MTDDEGAEGEDGVEVMVEAPPQPQPQPQPQIPNESDEVCFDEIDNNSNGLVDEECGSD